MSNLNIRNFPADMLLDLMIEAALRGVTLRGLVIERLSERLTVPRYELDVISTGEGRATVETKKRG